MTTPHREGHTLAPDGTRIAWQQFGDEGPIVLLANGIGCSWRALMPQVRDLSAENRVLTWDYRGIHGSGPAGEAGQRVEAHAGDARAVLDALDVESAGVVGWSMGVNVAFELALQAPERVERIAGLGGVPTTVMRAATGPGIHRIFRRLTRASAVVAPVASPVVSRVLRSPRFFDASVAVQFIRAEAEREAFLRMAADVAEQHHGDYLRTLAELAKHDRRKDLDKVGQPVLLLVGGRDFMIRPRVVQQAAKALPNARVEVVEGCSHFLTVEDPLTVNDHLQRFLVTEPE